MDQFTLNRLSTPIITGTPVGRPAGTREQSGAPNREEGSFQALLQHKLVQDSSVEFSRHAVSRVVERGIELSENSLTRLGEGMRIAQEKGLNDTLILIDRTAFIVNVKNNKVITTVDGDELKGNVFTNIDGTVII